MKKTGICLMFVLCAVVLAVQAPAQANRKPGLYEVTTSMSMAGMPGNMPGTGARTSQVCLTQAMIDKYGGPFNNPQHGNCQTTNMSVTPTGMTATVTCSGPMNSTGTVKSTFVDANTTRTTMHLKMAMNGQTMEMTTESTYTYKGPDCGSVKPLAMPSSQ
jgi:Protein of unknown function (DUF3617)